MKYRLLISFIFLIFGFSLSCSNTTDPSITDLYSLTIDPRLDVDENGYYSLKLDSGKFQTVHRVSGSLLKNGKEPYPPEKVSWEASHSWVLGDTSGLIIRRILTPEGQWVNVDTSYVTGFGGSEVPTINPASYSGTDGEINTMIAPVLQMKGDTLIVKCTYKELTQTVSIVLH